MNAIEKRIRAKYKNLNPIKTLKDKKEEIKEKLRDFTPAQETRRFRDDKPLQQWYNSHCKGHPLSQAELIISGGLERNEIAPRQAETLSIVLGFAGEAAFGKSKE